MDAGSSEGKIFLAAPLNKEDVIHLAEKKEVIKWDHQKGEIVERSELRIGEIIIETKPLKNISPEGKSKILCEVLRSEGINLLPWDDQTREWQKRLLSLKLWRPDEAWPDVSDEVLLATAEEWLDPYLTNIRKREDFKKLDLQNILITLLPWDLQQKFQQLVPEKMEVPTGSQIRLEYQSDGRPPVLAVRLQEVFGLMNTPSVNEGRTKVLMHLLSPGYKPVQVTQDLQSFWKTTYAEVRKELRVRYPKHHWPEDPWTAEAVRGVKRKNPK
ncbi:MAG: hypothetical protein K2X86_13750 [Cytophagaceae bacterium]|nr:hypothetical protein [Cytophagaceae bacterium]